MHVQHAFWVRELSSISYVASSTESTYNRVRDWAACGVKQGVTGGYLLCVPCVLEKLTSTYS